MKVGSKEQRAWAAGIYEGEGYIHYGQAHQSLILGVTNTDKQMLERLQKIFKSGQIHGPYKGNTKAAKKPKPIYRWANTTYEDIQMVVVLMWRCLLKRRKAQITKVFKSYHRHTKKYGRKKAYKRRIASVREI